MRKKIHWCPSHNNRMAENMILQSLCLSRKCGLLVKWKIERPNLLQSNQSSNPKSRLSLHSNHNILNQCSVFLGTWNVNGKKPEEPLDEWLLSTAVIPDIIAVGYVPLRRWMCLVIFCTSIHWRFQELDLSAEALFLGDTGRSQPWEELIMHTIAKRHPYVLVYLFILRWKAYHHLSFSWLIGAVKATGGDASGFVCKRGTSKRGDRCYVLRSWCGYYGNDGMCAYISTLAYLLFLFF